LAVHLNHATKTKLALANQTGIGNRSQKAVAKIRHGPPSNHLYIGRELGKNRAGKNLGFLRKFFRFLGF